MRLLILAAGFGGRLNAVLENTPKALIELTPGVTILDRQLEAARKCGIKDVIIVVGYQAVKIEERIRQLSHSDLNITTIYNPFYRGHNNFVSLWAALSAMDEDFIMLNGDNVFRPNLLSLLNESQREINILIASKTMYDEDDSKLILNDEKIVRLGKDIPIDKVDAEWIGMCAFTGKGRVLFIEKIKELIRKPELLDGPPHYLSVFQGLADDGVPLEITRIESGAWAEIDYQSDLEFVVAHLTRFNDR